MIVATLLAATSEAMAINYVTGEFLFAFSGADSHNRSVEHHDPDSQRRRLRRPNQ